MKTLSIKNPWATLIAHDIKPVENRTWPTKFRGRIYIHASAQDAGKIPDLLSIAQCADFIASSVDLRHSDYINSAIIGEVDIVDCVQNHPSVWAEHFADKELKDGTIKTVPVWNWVLANPVLYKEPILNVKGKLSFWEFNKDTPLIK